MDTQGQDFRVGMIAILQQQASLGGPAAHAPG
jgi:hypothetical protein